MGEGECRALKKGGCLRRIDTRYPPSSYLLKEKVRRYASYLNMKKMNMRLGVLPRELQTKRLQGPPRWLAGWLPSCCEMIRGGGHLLNNTPLLRSSEEEDDDDEKKWKWG